MSRPGNWSWDGLIRPNILKLEPYRCARDDYSAGILLDANENALGHAITEDAPPAELKLNRFASAALCNAQLIASF